MTSFPRNKLFSVNIIGGAIFVLILSAGFLGATLFTVNETFENRRLAPWPVWGSKSVLSTSFFPNLTKAVRDHHLFREPAIIYRNWIKFSLFGVSPSNKVTFGEDGWMFLLAPARGACREKRAPRQIALTIKQYLATLPAEQKQSVVIFPNKDFMYLNKIPAGSTARAIHACAVGRFNRDINAAKQTLPAQLIDLRRDINKKLKTAAKPLYFKQDTHWTFETSVWASGQILERLRPGLWRPQDVKVTGSKTRIQDISRIAGLPIPLKALGMVSRRKGVRAVKRDFSLRLSRRQPVRTFWYKSSSAQSPLIKGHTVLVYDSFLIPTFSVLSPYFEKITWVFWDDFMRPEAQAIIRKADRVVLASIYRLMPGRVKQMAKLSKLRQ